MARRICFFDTFVLIRRYVANKISRFLKWKGYNARVFSCCDVRKRLYPEYASPPAEYWNEKNEEMKELRLKVITDTLQELFAYLREGGQVGLFDGSNLSRSMREYITKLISNEVCLFVFVSTVAKRPPPFMDRNESQRHFDPSSPRAARKAFFNRVHGLRPPASHEGLREPRAIPDEQVGLVRSCRRDVLATTTWRRKKTRCTASWRSTRTTGSATSRTTCAATSPRRSCPS